jgi:hypothetical protein
MDLALLRSAGALPLMTMPVEREARQ